MFDLRPWAKEHRYRVRYEESFQAEKDPAVRGDGRDYVEIVCDRGIIYPIGDDVIAAKADTYLGELMMHTRGVESFQTGDEEVAVKFGPEALDRIAAKMKPDVIREKKRKGA